MVISVTSGWSSVVSNSTLTSGVPPVPRLLSMMAPAWSLALISDLKAPFWPSSATSSTPGLAMPPTSQKVTRSLCKVPISGEKCALPGRPPGVAAVVQVP